MTQIFLDVGGYFGDSVHAALHPIFGFDRVYSFEPVAGLAQNLKNIRDKRLTVIQAGLFEATAKRTIYHAGTLAGSIYPDSPSYLEEGSEQVCEFIEASQFFRDNILDQDVVYMKLNCEGAECAILENLIASGEVKKLTEALVDFDALKIPSQANRVDMLVHKMVSGNVPHHTPEQVQYGMINNYGGIRNWLLVTGAKEGGALRKIRSAIYQLGIMRTKDFNGYYKMRILRKMPWLQFCVNKLRGRAS